MVASIETFVPQTVRTGALFCVGTTAITALFMKAAHHSFPGVKPMTKVLILTASAFIAAKVMGIALPILVNVIGATLVGLIGTQMFKCFQQNQKVDKNVKLFVEKAGHERFTFYYSTGPVTLYKTPCGLFTREGDYLDYQFYVVTVNQQSRERISQFLSKWRDINSEAIVSRWEMSAVYAFRSIADETTRHSLSRFNEQLTAIKSAGNWPTTLSFQLNNKDCKITFEGLQFYSDIPLEDPLLRVLNIMLSHHFSKVFTYKGTEPKPA